MHIYRSLSSSLAEWACNGSVFRDVASGQVHSAAECIDGTSSSERRGAVSQTDVSDTVSQGSVHTGGTSAEVMSACLGKVCDDEDDDDEVELHGEVAPTTSSPAPRVDEQGVVEQLAEPTSKRGVSQQHDDVRSGLQCADCIINNSRCDDDDSTLTSDWDTLGGNSWSGFVNTSSGCFIPTPTTSHTHV